jgi:hypothetical protein
MDTDGENVDALFSLCAHAGVEDARFLRVLGRPLNDGAGR